MGRPLTVALCLGCNNALYFSAIFFIPRNRAMARNFSAARCIQTVVRCAISIHSRTSDFLYMYTYQEISHLKNIEKEVTWPTMLGTHSNQINNN